MLHLAEHLTIGLAERLTLNDSTFGIGCSLESIVESFTSEFVGKSSGITNKDNVISCRWNGIQRDIGTTDMLYWYTKLGKRLTELRFMTREVFVRLQRGETIHISALTGELIENTRFVVTGEMNEHVVVCLSFVVLFKEQGM